MDRNTFIDRVTKAGLSEEDAGRAYVAAFGFPKDAVAAIYQGKLCLASLKDNCTTLVTWIT